MRGIGWGVVFLLSACLRTPAAPAPPPRDPPPSQAATRLFEEALGLLEQGDTEGARERLDRAIGASPTFALARVERGTMLLEADRERTLAFEDARIAVSLLGDNPRAHLLLARLLDEEGEFSEASDAYLRSLELRDDMPTRRRLGTSLGRAERHGEAAQVWESIVEASPSDLGSRLALADAYEKAARAASAEAEWARIVELAGDNPFILRRFAAFLEREGWNSRAQAALERANELDAPEERSLRPLLPSKY